MVDFMQDNWKVKVDYPINVEWTGKTFFRVYGPYESDYNIESVEIREAITDYEFVGREKEGECMISMFSPRSMVESRLFKGPFASVETCHLV